MGATKIEWADKVWNPITGCTPISEGCVNCYARRMANRLRGRCGYPPSPADLASGDRSRLDPFRVTFHPDKLDEPLKWRKPCRVFVGSMGDIGHDDVTDDMLRSVFLRACACYRHTFLFLTKRPKRMARFIDGIGLPLPENIWIGVSAENQARADERIPILLSILATVHFVSVEPMIGPVDLVRWMDITYSGDGYSAVKGRAAYGDPRTKLDWVIAGPETGPGARECKTEWIEDLYKQCKAAGVPFFDKRDPWLAREWPGEN